MTILIPTLLIMKITATLLDMGDTMAMILIDFT
jgi:hypothetical protein